jgi:hypothetical protein
MSLLPVLAALVALAGPMRAPSAEEARLYDEGMKAFAAGDARGAEKSWRAGYAVGHDPAFLVHIGEAEEKAGAPAEAVESYRRYLREAPDASDRADIEARLARLAPAAPAPPPAPGAPGPAPEATGEFGGTPPPAGPPPPARPPAPGARPPAPAGTGVDVERPGGPAAAPDSGWNRYNVTAFVAAGASVLLLGTAAFFAAKASSDRDDVDRLVLYHDQAGNPDQYSAIAAQYEKAMRDGPQHDHDAKVALIGAAGAAAVSVLFFVLDAQLTPEPAVAIAPAATGRGAQASWTWRF